MNDKPIKVIAAAGLLIGAIFGMIGSFVTSPSLRGFAWGIDGIALVIAAALLTVYYYRKGYDLTAAGFLIFAIGEGFILSCPGINPYENIESFATGTGLWAASMAIISSQKVFPMLVRCLGVIAAALFSIVSFLIFTGHPLNPLSEPLPFFAYPFFAATIFGWVWTLLRSD